MGIAYRISKTAYNLTKNWRLLVKADALAQRTKTVFRQMSEINKLVSHTNYISDDQIIMIDLHIIFLIRNRFIRNQYSIFFGIKKPSTHIPRA